MRWPMVWWHPQLVESERKCYILVDQGKTMADMGTTGWQWFPIPYDGMSAV